MLPICDEFYLPLNRILQLMEILGSQILLGLYQVNSLVGAVDEFGFVAGLLSNKIQQIIISLQRHIDHLQFHHTIYQKLVHSFELVVLMPLDFHFCLLELI